MKSCFVLWSAGVDSTYLILRLLEAGYQVNAGYIKIQNNYHKTRMELAAIRKMAPKLERMFQHFVFEGTIYSAKNYACARGIRYRQVPYFLHALLAAPRTDYRALGYVHGDSSIKNIEKIRAVYNSYNLIYNGVLPILTFPIKNTSKPQIFKYMQDKYSDILPDCVWCEDPHGPRFMPCGWCTPCQRRTRELQALTLEVS